MELVQRLIEASLYRCFVAGKLREGVSLVGTPDKVLPSKAVCVSCSAFHLLGSRECFLMLLFAFVWYLPVELPQ